MSTAPNSDRQALSGRTLVWLWVGLNVMSLIFLMVAWYLGFASWRLATQGGRATGRVVDYVESDDEGTTMYAPVIEFRAGGGTYRFETGIASAEPAYPIGERVPVLYDPANPSRARIDAWADLWALPTVFGAAGLLGLVGENTALYFVWQRRQQALGAAAA